MSRTPARSTLATALLLATLAACSSDPSGPNGPAVLDGLVEAVAMDSTGTPPPPPTDPSTGTGQVRGTVLAPSEPGAGNDSLQTAPRIAGATLTAYPVLTSNPLTLGVEVAMVVTDAAGHFELPTLPTGDYVVTVEPPAASASVYYGQWIHGQIHPQSIDHPWWLVLAKR